MPTISQFYGITIQMFYDDHAPPHFHASYGEDEIIVSLSPIAIMKGKVPNRVRSMVFEWAALHQQDLMDNWMQCQSGESPQKLEPLE
jgi:hypothetical protein